MEYTRIKMAALWTVVMFYMTFADIIGFLNPGTLEGMMRGEVGIPLSSPILLLISVINAIPIAMIFLSLVLPTPTIRLVSALAAGITALYVVGGGSATPAYFLYAGLEIVCMGLAVWYAYKELR